VCNGDCDAVDEYDEDADDGHHDGFACFANGGSSPGTGHDDEIDDDDDDDDVDEAGGDNGGVNDDGDDGQSG